MATRVADGSDAQADLARQKRPLSARPARCRASRRRSLDLTDSNRSPFTPTARQLPPQRYAARTIIGLARSPLPFFCFPRVAELSHAPRRRLLRRRERATRSSVRPRPHGQVFPRNCRRCEHCAHLCRAAGFPRHRARRPQRGDLHCRHFPRTPHVEPARRHVFGPAAIRQASRMLIDSDHPTGWSDPARLGIAGVGDFGSLMARHPSDTGTYRWNR